MRRKTVTEIALAGTLCAFVLCIFVPVIYCIWSVKKKKRFPRDYVFGKVTSQSALPGIMAVSILTTHTCARTTHWTSERCQ